MMDHCVQTDKQTHFFPFFFFSVFPFLSLASAISIGMYSEKALTLAYYHRERKGYIVEKRGVVM